ncbi:MAG: tetratricopeptide repeat protein [Treponema sp.]|nr:tetratricopeptide repeat protein [Candidatus Treponema scatequi]
MKKLSTLVVSLILILSVFSCTKSNKTIIRMQHFEEGVSNPNTIEEYEDAIKKYEERVADIQLAQAQIGIWHKIVGARYLDKKMYGEALKSFQGALLYYPDNQNLYYYVGVCAGYMSHTALDYDGNGSTTKKMNYLKLAEESYKRAIDIEPRYARALFGLAALYDMELGQPEQAIPYVENLLTIETKNKAAMMLLARCYYETYEFDKAAAAYDMAISVTKDKKQIEELQKLKDTVLEAKEIYAD